jgi:IS5 family transposase
MFLRNPNYDHNKAYTDRNYNEPELLDPTPVDNLTQAFGSALEDFLEARKALKKEKITDLIPFWPGD